MKKLIILLFVSLVFVYGCSKSELGDDKTYSKSVLGSWSEGETPYSIAIFKEGGVYEGEVYKSPDKKEVIFTVKGKWWVTEGRLYNEVHKFTPATVPVTDKVYIDTIVSITKDTMTLIDEKGVEYSKKRIQ